MEQRIEDVLAWLGGWMACSAEADQGAQICNFFMVNFTPQGILRTTKAIY
jgi:hypothetical protein